MKNTKLPPADQKFASIVEGELVTLKPTVDDKDYTRIYKVLEKAGTKLTVEVVKENPINRDKYAQVHNKQNTMVGVVFTEEESYFQPYM